MSSSNTTKNIPEDETMTGNKKFLISIEIIVVFLFLANRIGYS